MVTPAVWMSMWAAGLALCGALVVAWKIVGRGYLALTCVVVSLFGLGVALLTGHWVAWVGLVLAVAAVITPAGSNVPVWLLIASAGGFMFPAFYEVSVFGVITGAAFLGGVTTEMTLGHWFLIDPTLPRWSLVKLLLAAVVGLAADVLFLAASGLISGVQTEPVLGLAYLALVSMTVLLLVGVRYSLKEPSYTGVMAATGLSYLAVLTALGTIFAGRILVGQV